MVDSTNNQRKDGEVVTEEEFKKSVHDANSIESIDYS